MDLRDNVSITVYLILLTLDCTVVLCSFYYLFPYCIILLFSLQGCKCVVIKSVVKISWMQRGGSFASTQRLEDGEVR